MTLLRDWLEDNPKAARRRSPCRLKTVRLCGTAMTSSGRTRRLTKVNGSVIELPPLRVAVDVAV
jgi:hypothetical protein